MTDRDLYMDLDVADLDQLAEYDLFIEDEPSDLAEDLLDEAPYLDGGLPDDEMDDDER